MAVHGKGAFDILQIPRQEKKVPQKSSSIYKLLVFFFVKTTEWIRVGTKRCYPTLTYSCTVGMNHSKDGVWFFSPKFMDLQLKHYRWSDIMWIWWMKLNFYSLVDR